MVIFLATNWEMVSAIGQVIGAIGTVAAVWIALLQIIEIRRQENRKNQQEGTIKFTPKGEDQFEIILTNVNAAPIFVNKAALFRINEHPVRKQISYEPIEDQRIQSEAHKLITQGDICKMTVSLDLLLDEVEKNNHMFLSAYFFSTSGGFFRRSLYVEKKQEDQFEIHVAKEQKETRDLNEMDLWRTIVFKGKKVISSIESNKSIIIGDYININSDNIVMTLMKKK